MTRFAVQPGDIVVFFGDPHLVDRIVTRADGSLAAKAADGWGIALDDDATLLIPAADERLCVISAQGTSGSDRGVPPCVPARSAGGLAHEASITDPRGAAVPVASRAAGDAAAQVTRSSASQTPEQPVPQERAARASERIGA